MPPLIVDGAHEKNVLSLEDFFLGEDYKVLSKLEIIEEPNFRFLITIAVSDRDDSGLVEIRFVNQSLLVGNIRFDIEKMKYIHLVDGCVAQIRSAFIEPKFRGFQLATNAYGQLCDFFNVVSDDLQTCDGAALWRYSIPKLDHVDIQLIQNALTAPEYILDSDGGEPIRFDETRFEFEKIIWSAENGDAFDLARQQAGIDCALGIMNRDVVLIAIKKSQLLH